MANNFRQNQESAPPAAVNNFNMRENEIRSAHSQPPDGNTGGPPVGYSFIEGVSLLFDKLTNSKLRFDVLLDTGSPENFIQLMYVPKSCVKSSVNGFEFVGINKTPIHIIGSVQCAIEFRGKLLSDVLFHVVKNGTMFSPAIFGRTFMEKARLRLTEIPGNTRLIWDSDKPTGLTLDESDSFTEQILNIDVSFLTKEPTYIVNSNIPYKIKEELNSLINICTSSETKFDNKPSQVKCAIRLVKDEAFFCSPRRLSYAEKASVRTILDELLEQGVIRPSESQYSSPIVLVRKKNTTKLRMCIDYRRLNKLTARDNYPLPLIEDQMDQLNDKTYFSCIDLKDGFHLVTM